MPPAHLIEEFADYLAKTCGQKRIDLFKALCYQHHLHSGNQLYTASDCRVQTQSRLHYQKQQTPGQNAACFLTKAIDIKKPPTQLHIDSLIAFWHDPSAYLLQQRYQIKTAAIGRHNDERDEFYWDALQDYKIRDLLFSQSGDVRLERLQAARVLPIANFGSVLFLEKKSIMEPFIAIKKSLNVHEADIIPLAHYQIQSRQTWRDAAGHLQFVIPHTWNNKRRLYCWIQHLLANYQKPQDSTVHYLHGNSIAQEHFQAHHDAAGLLEVFVDGFISGQHEPLPFFLNTSYTYADSIFKDKDSAETDQATAKIWHGSSFSAGESQQPHIHLCWHDPEHLIKEPAFKQWANDIWQDYLGHRSK